MPAKLQLRTGAGMLRRQVRPSPTLGPTVRCDACLRAEGYAFIRTPDNLGQSRAQFHSGRRKSSAWGAAMAVASNMVGNAVSRAAKGDLPLDPMRIVASE